jgi:hypothetical protein
VGGLAPPARTGDRDRLGEVFRCAVVAARDLDHLADDGLGAEVALTHSGIESRHVADAELVGDLGERLMGHHPLQREALLAQQAADLLLAVLDRFLATLLGEPVADLAARPR